MFGNLPKITQTVAVISEGRRENSDPLWDILAPTRSTRPVAASSLSVCVRDSSHDHTPVRRECLCLLRKKQCTLII